MATSQKLLKVCIINWGQDWQNWAFVYYPNYISSMLDQCAPINQRVSAFLSVWKGFFCFCFLTSLWQKSYYWSESTLRFLIFQTCVPNMNSVLNDIILYCRKQEECCWNIAEGIPIFGVCFKFSATTFTQWCQVSIYHLETKTGLSFLQVIDVQFQSYATSIVIDEQLWHFSSLADSTCGKNQVNRTLFLTALIFCHNNAL